MRPDWFNLIVWLGLIPGFLALVWVTVIVVALGEAQGMWVAP